MRPNLQWCYAWTRGAADSALDANALTSCDRYETIHVDEDILRRLEAWLNGKGMRGNATSASRWLCVGSVEVMW